VLKIQEVNNKGKKISKNLNFFIAISQ